MKKSKNYTSISLKKSGHTGNQITEASKLSFAKAFILPFLLLLIPVMSFSQFTGTVSSTESVCIADGTVTVTGADPTSIYALTGNSIPQSTLGPGSTSYTFTALPAGNYTVTEFKTNNTEPSSNISVPGNYEQNWQFTASVNLGNCSDGNVGNVIINNFTITNATAVQQRPPYEFRISAPNGTLPANGQGLPNYESVTQFVFPSTVVGNSFQMQARDACGNFKTYSIQVPNQPPAPTLNFTRVGYVNCNGDSNYSFTASGGTSPYLMTIISSTAPGDPLVGQTSNTNPTNWVFLASTTYVVRVRDECGAVAQRTINTPAYVAPCISATGAPGDCGMGEGTGALTITTCQSGIGPYTIRVVGNDCVFDQTYNNVSVNFLVQNLPRPCNYTITVTDACDETRSINVGLSEPSNASLSCNHNLQCPATGSELIRLQTNVTNGPPYNPTYPVSILIVDSGNNPLPTYPKVMTEDSGRRNTQALAPGTYTYTLTDACGVTCSNTVVVPLYTSPVATIDTEQQCYGSGRILLLGVNGNPLGNSSNTYTIIAGPSRVGNTSEPDAPPGTGMFSSLISNGTYTFRYNDGCRNFEITETIPTWTQPTYEVSFGLICGDDNTSDLHMVNLQPEGQVALPYHYTLIGTNSNQYAGPLPFPNSTGQTSTVFENLPPNMNGSTATYFFLGYDNCKNSFQAAGAVGFFPDEYLVLSATSVCAGPESVVTARVTTPIVGATYEYYRDGVLVASSNNLFTTIQPALPGEYTARILFVNASGVPCETETPAITVTALGELIITDPDPKCPAEGVDLTAASVTAGSSSGTYSYYLDPELTQPLLNPDFVVLPGTYYIRLITDGGTTCDLSAPVQVVNTICCPDIDISASILVDTECGEENAAITVIATGNDFGYIYRWEDEDGNIISTEASVSGLGIGVYTVFVRANVDGCESEVSHIIPVGTLEGPVLSITTSEPTCSNSDGSIEVVVTDGNGPYSYVWSTGSTASSLENISPGSYSVTVTDSNGCEEVASIELTSNNGSFNIEAIVTSSECNSSNGIINAMVSGEIAPVTYLWSNGETTSEITNLSSGVYTVTATDGNGCSVVLPVIVNDSPMSGGPTLNVNVTNEVTCHGENQGSVQLSSPDASLVRVFNEEGLLVGGGNIIENLTAGHYFALAVTAAGCETRIPFMIEGPEEVLDLIIERRINTQCENNGTGLIQAIAVGGTSPYTFNWTGPDDFMSNLSSISSLFSGTYTVTMTDANDCTLSASVFIDITDITAPDLTECLFPEIILECAGEENINIINNWHTNNLTELALCIQDQSEFTIIDNFDEVSLNGGCSEFTGSITVTYYAVDECGLESEPIEITLTLLDRTAPDLTSCDLESMTVVIECNADPVNQIAEWVAANIAMLENCATDICSEFEVSSNLDEVSFEEDCSETTGSITVTFSVTDECNNVSTTSATLTIEDTTAPDLTACDLESMSTTVECTGDPEAQINTWVAANIALLENCATDICSEFVVSSNLDESEFINSCSATTGEITVVYSVTDECNNVSTASATLTIVDTTVPDLSLCDIPALNQTLECTGDPEAQINEWMSQNLTYLTNCFSDICSEYEVFPMIISDGFETDCSASTGTITVVFVAMDQCNNVQAVQGSLTIIDTTAPDLEACDIPSMSVTAECNGDLQNQIESWVAENISMLESCASDLCSEIQVSSNLDAVQFENSCSANTGQITVIFTVTDECGNESTASATLTIEDTTAPDLANCDIPSMTTILECSGNPESQINSWVNENIMFLAECASDICSEMSVSSNVADQVFDTACSPNTGSITVTFTVTDECGNFSTAEATLTIEDTTAPDLSACDLPSMSITIECSGDPESQINSWVAQNIAILESCTSDICSDMTVSSNLNDTEFAEACSTSTGSIEVEFYITDACNNTTSVTATLTIEDTTAPDLSNCDLSGMTSTVECNGNSAGLIASWLAQNMSTLSACTTDECSNIVISNNFENSEFIEGCSELTGTVTVIFAATDACGNSSTFEANITIEDTTAPDLSTCDLASLNATVECNGTPEEQIATWVAANSSLLAQCASDVCSAEISVSSNVEEVDFSTACSPKTGGITVIFTVTDQCGNSSTTSATLLINDTTAPDLSACAPANVTLACNRNENQQFANSWHQANLSALQACAADDCSETFTITSNYNWNNFNYLCGQTGSLTVLYTVTDACGNSSNYTATFSVLDNIAPEISWANPDFAGFANGENIVVQCGASDADWNLPQFSASDISATDECSLQVSISMTSTETDRGDCAVDGYFYKRVYTWIATDACGNSSAISLNIVVVDTIAPTLSGVPGNISVSCEDVPPPPHLKACDEDDDCCAEAVIAIDECECAEIFFEERIEGNECDTEFRIIRTWTAIDNCGNAASESQIIDVHRKSEMSLNVSHSDLEGIEPFGDLWAPCTGETGTPAWLYKMVSAEVKIENNCKFAPAGISYDVTQYTNDGPCSELGYQQHWRITWAAKDECGNTAEVWYNVFIYNNTAPEITLDTLVCSTTDAIAEATSFCAENVTLTHFDETVRSLCGRGTDILRTWTAIDECGNVNNAQQRILRPEENLSGIEILDSRLTGDTISVDCNASFLNGGGFSEYDVVITGSCGEALPVSFKEEIMEYGDCSNGENWVYMKKITWAANDLCLGELSHEVMVRVMSTTAPEFHDQDIEHTISCGEIFTPKVTAFCSDIVRIEMKSQQVLPGFDCEKEILMTMTFEAEDACGKISTADYTIRQIRNRGVEFFGIEADTLYCPENISLPAARDMCSGQELNVTYVETQVPSKCNHGETFRRTYTAIDACGHIYTRIQYYVKNDSIAPQLVFHHPLHPEVQNGDEILTQCYYNDYDQYAPLEIGAANIMVVADCHYTLDYTSDVVVSADCKMDGFALYITHKWSATDGCGNIATFIVYEKQIDNLPPVWISTPASHLVTCGSMPPVVPPVAKDECSNIMLNYSQTLISTTETHSIWNRHWVATDGCGNFTDFIQQVQMNTGSNFNCQIQGTTHPFCNSDNNILTVTSTNLTGAPYTYNWVVNGGVCTITSGQNTPQITYSIGFSNASITVEITDSNGCTTYCSVRITCTSTDARIPGSHNDVVQGLEENSAMVFPNPAYNEAFVRINATSNTTAKILIMNALSEVISESRHTISKGQNEFFLDLSKLTAAVYHVMISLEGEEYITRPLIIIK